MNIYEKLSEITNEMKSVAKNLEVGIGKNSYKAVGEADVLKAVKELEYKYKVYSYPVRRTIVDKDVLTTKKEYNGTITESNQLFLRLEVVYRFVNIENPEEFIEITTYGDGIDTQDKSVGKAMTYADKYALMKAYKIITGDDPDQEPSPEKVTYEKAKVTKITSKPVAIKPEDEMLFGKYKGKKWKDIYIEDSGYIDWIIDEADKKGKSEEVERYTNLKKDIKASIGASYIEIDDSIPEIFK